MCEMYLSQNEPDILLETNETDSSSCSQFKGPLKSGTDFVYPCYVHHYVDKYEEQLFEACCGLCSLVLM